MNSEHGIRESSQGMKTSKISRGGDFQLETDPSNSELNKSNKRQLSSTPKQPPQARDMFLS